jgi:MFS family permease
MATAFSIPSARLGARFGYRLPGIAGAILFCAGQLWFITQTGDAPAYASEYLPGMLIGGAGVGLMIPTLTGAGASSLPPARFATGAAVLTMGRQIGAALGIAVLVAVLGGATRTAADFHSAWLISVAGGACAGLLLAALGSPAFKAAGADDPARPQISEAISDPLIAEPLVVEEPV